MREMTSISARRACRLVGVSRSVNAYQAKTPDCNTLLKDRLIELAHERRRFGYRRLHILLRREGVSVNHKRVYRLYHEAGLMVKRRRRRHGVAVEREPLACAGKPNAVWSMDFVSDALANGRRIKVLTIVDDFSKECIDLVADYGISGHYVVRLLEQAARFRGYPAAIRTDQGPEFTGNALDQWASVRGITLKLTQPGKPTQNAYIESFNGRLRDECLNEHWFMSLSHVRAELAVWRKDYNEARPHSSLDYQTPAAFAACFRMGEQAELAQKQEFLTDFTK